MRPLHLRREAHAARFKNGYLRKCFLQIKRLCDTAGSPITTCGLGARELGTRADVALPRRFPSVAASTQPRYYSLPGPGQRFAVTLVDIHHEHNGAAS